MMYKIKMTDVLEQQALEGTEDTLPGDMPKALGKIQLSTSLHREILTRLRDYIVEGNLPDGARVPERLLCEMLGISRTPLREALKVLSSEGLIDLLPNRGSRVRRLNPQEVRELFEIMGGLEALAGRLACENIDQKQFEEIESLHHKMDGLYLRRRLPEYLQCNQLIHQKIVAAAGNITLLATYAGFADRIRRVRYWTNLDRKRDRWSDAMREHEVILDALRRRAGDDLANILFLHLRNKLEEAAEYPELKEEEHKTLK
jgi:DNA-binding GntR family transcriptional regulator